jgi:hypothetical protein
LDLLKDEYIYRMIEQIGDHYRSNVSNRFIRPALLQLALDKRTWDHIENLTEKYERSRYQGFHYDDLYRQIAAAARFVYGARRDITPTLRHRLSHISSDGSDKTLRDMTINNFSFNLKFLADLLYELYTKVTELDTAASRGKRPVYQQMPELADIVRHLTSV